MHLIRNLQLIRNVYRFCGANKHVYHCWKSLVLSKGFLVHHVFYKRGLFSLFDRILLELNGFLNENNIIKGLRLILMITIKLTGLTFSIEIILTRYWRTYVIYERSAKFKDIVRVLLELFPRSCGEDFVERKVEH